MSLTLRRQRRTTPYDKVAPLAADARDTAARYASTTRDWAAPKAAAAKDWAAPKVEPAVEKVKSDVVPAVAGAVTAALAAAEPVRHEAASRGSAALAALKGEVEAPKPKKHRLRKFFLLASVLGAAYAGWKAWSAQSAQSDPVDAWKTPSGGTTPAAAMTTSGAGVSVVPPVDRPTTDDPGGAGPDEAVADAVDEAVASGESDDKPTVTTETVTPAAAKKTAQAAKSASKKPSGT